MLVEMKDICKDYPQGKETVRILKNINLQVEEGDYLAIMGPSGSGKSTLMHCLAGLDRPTAGQVWLGGTEITGLDDRRLTRVRRDHVGFVFQAFNLLPTLTARENILLPLDLAGRKVDRGHFEDLVASLRLGDRLSHLPSQLSGGQQQRGAIARALITRPQVLFADEPTGALDSRTGTELLSHLRSASTELGQTIVMVTHDPNAAAFAQRALILSDGRLVDDQADPTADTVAAALRKLAA